MSKSEKTTYLVLACSGAGPLGVPTGCRVCVEHSALESGLSGHF